METSSLNLFYLERNPSTKQPSACVCVKVNARPDYGGIGADKLTTVPCLSFIELDAENQKAPCGARRNPRPREEEVLRAQAATAGA